MQRFETKFDLLQEAYKDTSLKKGTIALLQYLVYKSNREECYVSVGTIAAALNVCVRTVQNNMRKLEQAGYVIRKDRWYDHQQLSNRYIFNLGVTDEAEGEGTPADQAENVQAFREAEYEEYDKYLIHREMDIWKWVQELESENPKDTGDAEPFSKIELLKEIYALPLSGREKELLVYLIHKANERGMAYVQPEVFMEAVGVASATLEKWLKKLRDKSLIKVQAMDADGKKVILVTLDSSILQKEGKTGLQEEDLTQQLSAKESSELSRKPENSMRISRQKGVIYMIKNQICKKKSKMKELWPLLPFRLKKVRKTLLL